MRTFPSQSYSPGVRRGAPFPPALVLRRERPSTVKTVVERRTVQQTVVHNHITQVVRQTLLPRQDTVYRFLPQPGTAREESDARSRPTLAARRLVSIFSAESARRELRPFFRTVVRDVLEEEREQIRRRPEQGVDLVCRLFGERYWLQTLERYRRETEERTAAQQHAPSPGLPEREADAPALTGAQFQALVRGVERSLERKNRLEALRGGRA